METITTTRLRGRSFGDERQVGLLERSNFLRLDPWLAFAAFGLIAMSVVIIGLATQVNDTGNPYHYVLRQGIYAIVGLALMFALARVDYSRFRELRVGIYIVLIVILLVVLAVAVESRGVQRWIELPFFRFQPSEIGKLLLIMALAGFAIDRTRRGASNSWKRTARLLAIGVFPGLLIALQPDLDATIIYGLITLTIMFLAGIDWRHFAALGGLLLATAIVALVVAPALGFPVLQGYQAERLTSFVDPSEDPADASYQSSQAIIAVGSGGKTGLGDDATQALSGFLPEAHTDFIFAVTAERWGFLGAALLLSLYALLVWRALRIATLSKNVYGSLVAGGIAAMLIFQGFVNVGMNLGVMPVAGIPLPLVSYGGSSVLATFMAVGVLQSVYVQSQLASPVRTRPAL
jgi:rod shape determining protein RodA